MVMSLSLENKTINIGLRDQKWNSFIRKLKNYFRIMLDYLELHMLFIPCQIFFQKAL